MSKLVQLWEVVRYRFKNYGPGPYFMVRVARIRATKYRANGQGHGEWPPHCMRLYRFNTRQDGQEACP